LNKASELYINLNGKKLEESTETEEGTIVFFHFSLASVFSVVPGESKLVSSIYFGLKFA
jgi:hypothetical protein